MLHGLGLRAAKAPASCILQMARYRGAIACSPIATHTKLMMIGSPQRLRPEDTLQAHPLFSAPPRGSRASWSSCILKRGLSDFRKEEFGPFRHHWNADLVKLMRREAVGLYD